MSASKKPLSSCHCINARRISGLISELYDRSLKPTGLTISQYSLLRNLEHSPDSSISELAAQMGLDRTTLARNLKPLMERGLICDMAEPNRRNRKLALTEAGQSLLDQGKLLWENAQRDLTERLGEDTLRQFESILLKLQA